MGAAAGQEPRLQGALRAVFHALVTALQGKWKAKQIDNPAYKGEWKPKQIRNPDFFKVESPYAALSPIAAIGARLLAKSPP